MSITQKACTICLHPGAKHSQGPRASGITVCSACPDGVCTAPELEDAPAGTGMKVLGLQIPPLPHSLPMRPVHTHEDDGTVEGCPGCFTRDGWDTSRDAARDFMVRCGLEPTPDAIGQLAEVFLPCLKIMCGRPWSPDGATWRRSGVLGALTDVRKKFERFWYRGWTKGKRNGDVGFTDSGHDLINFIGFSLRADPDSGWGGWGEPARPEVHAHQELGPE